MHEPGLIDVSIIIPCYNDAVYINETLNAVKNQTYTNWECIIINDGSTDNTKEVVLNATQDDKRFIYIETENSGTAAARNTGIGLATGFFILPLDADDTISADYLKECIQVFDQDRDIKLVYGNEEHMKKTIKPPKSYNWESLLFENMIHCSGMYKKDDWKNANGYDVNMRYGYEDWEFWIRLINKTGKVVKLENIVLYVRSKNNSRTVIMNSFQQALMRQHIYQKHTIFYNVFFTDPLILYSEYNFYRSTLKAIEKKPFYFAMSRLFKKIKG
jgi:glycosyltransferase involved in cell wall biosynthesis